MTHIERKQRSSSREDDEFAVLIISTVGEKLRWKKGDVILPDEGAVLLEEKDTVNSSLSWRNFLKIC